MLQNSLKFRRSPQPCRLSVGVVSGLSYVAGTNWHAWNDELAGPYWPSTDWA